MYTMHIFLASISERICGLIEVNNSLNSDIPGNLLFSVQT